MYLLDKEKALVTQAKKGNRQAMAQLYDGLFPGVYAYTRLRLPTTADAEDVVSDTFIAVVNRLPHFQWETTGSFRAWVFQIARNHIANFYRRQEPDATTPLDEVPDTCITQPFTPEDTLIQAELKYQLLTAIHQLSPRRQEILLLRYFGGLRNNEIALALSLDERTVSAHLSRALAELQTILDKNQEITKP